MTVEKICRLLSAASAIDGECVVTGVTSNDADVQPGDLFLAYPGKSTHGAKFAQSAIAKGARAILTDAQGAQIAQ
ncbi:MAG: Mur ligase domain-containing protein, partial [Candidatus Planktophila sp.]